MKISRSSAELPAFFVVINGRTDAVELGSGRARLRRGKRLGLCEPAKTVSKNPELAPASLRQHDF